MEYLTFEESCFLLEEYKKEHGNLNMLISYTVETDMKERGTYALGRFLNVQRRRYRMGILTKERLERLNSIDKDWLKPVRERKIKEYIEATKKYVKNNNTVYFKGDKFIKVNGNSVNLREVSGNIKRRYKNGTIDAQNLKKLNAISSDWNLSKEEQRFNFLVSLYKKYRDYYGTNYVPYEYVTKKEVEGFEGVCLGTFYRRMRVKHEKGSISKEQEDKLSSVDSNWYLKTNNYKAYTPLQRLKFLKIYCLFYGDINVPMTYKTSKEIEGVDGYCLGAYIAYCRKNYKEGKLPLDLIKSLEDLGINWQINNTKIKGITPDDVKAKKQELVNVLNNLKEKVMEEKGIQRKIEP